MMFGDYLFTVRPDRTIETPGVDLSGQVTLVHDEETYQLWHVSSGHCYSGQGRPWTYVPARYLIVQIVGYDEHHKCLVARRIKERRPGARWRQARLELIEETRRLSQGRAPASPADTRNGRG